MVTPQFRSLLIHTCTIEAITQAAVSAPTYGHNPSVTSHTPVVTGLSCRMRPLTSEEQVDLGHEGSITATHTLYVAWEDLPAGFSPRFGPTKYVVTSVVRKKDGVLVDAGPLDVREVTDAAGEGHHAQIMLRHAM